MLEEGINVLDSGCGPATWVFEMGETYQRSTFHGVDAACVFPEDIKPANVELVIGNVAKNIPYPDENFHYVHQRLLFLGLSQSDWDGVTFNTCSLFDKILTLTPLSFPFRL